MRQEVIKPSIGVAPYKGKHVNGITSHSLTHHLAPYHPHCDVCSGTPIGMGGDVTHFG